MNQDSGKIYLTAKEAAEFLRIGTGHLYNLVNRGELLPLKIGCKKKGRLLFTAKQLNEFIGANHVSN